MSCILLVPRKWQAILFWPLTPMLSPPHVHSRLSHTSRWLFVGNSPTLQFSSVRNCVDQGSGGMRSAAPPPAVMHLGIEPQRWRNPVSLGSLVSQFSTPSNVSSFSSSIHTSPRTPWCCATPPQLCVTWLVNVFFLPLQSSWTRLYQTAHEKHLSCFH